MWNAKMKELEYRSKSWWKTRRRFVASAVFIFCLALVLVAFSSSNIVYIKTDKNGHFSGFSLHRIAEFPWGDNDTLNNVNLGGTKKLPRALLIGAKKAGTRALLEFIRVHPNVRAAGHEVHFFDKNFSKGQEWYREMMPTSIDGQITMEKTPSYLVTKEAPKRVYDFNPNIKLIVVLKDPVDRAISDFMQSFTKHKTKRSFEESVFSDLAGLVVNESKPSIRTGAYFLHLKRWMEYFPLKQFCFINGENMVTHPAVELGKLQDFLNLERIIIKDYFYFNATKGFPCLKKREASGVPHCLGNGKGRTHPNVSTNAKVALYDYYEPFNQELYKMTGVNFNWERRKPFFDVTNE